MSGISVLFVGYDNICRSAAALALARSELERRHLSGLRLDAAGTSWRHVGEPATAPIQNEARRRGLPVDHLARRASVGDFSTFDLLIAMDTANLTDLERLRGGMDLRTTFHAISEPFQVQLIRRWDPYAMPGDEDLGRPEPGSSAQIQVMFDTLARSMPPLFDHLEEMAASAI